MYKYSHPNYLRNFDPYLTHFTQPDTIIPDLYNPQSLNRFSYVLNNPLKYNDPTGHKVTCDTDENCKLSQQLSHLDGINYWKAAFKGDFGVTLKDGGAEHPNFTDKNGNPTSHGLNWDSEQAFHVYIALSNINNALGGNLKTIIGSASFTLNTHPIFGKYYGVTTGNTIDFYNNTTMPLQNIYHEFGHVLNNLPGQDNHFSDALQNYDHRSFILTGGDKAGQLDPLALNSAANDAYQHPSTDPKEQWGDIFANYVAGNINQGNKQGADMYNFITGVLP